MQGSADFCVNFSRVPAPPTQSPFQPWSIGSKVASLEASSTAVDLAASHFPQLPRRRQNPEQVEGCKAPNRCLESSPARKHRNLLQYAHARLLAGQKNYSRVSRDLGHELLGKPPSLSNN